MTEPKACCQEWRDECNAHLSRISELEQQRDELLAALIELEEAARSVQAKEWELQSIDVDRRKAREVIAKGQK